MKVLVAFASKHHATDGIARAIASALGQAGIDADVRPISADTDTTGYDAFVIGSAVYAGQAMRETDGFIRSNVSFLRQHPVWLFSSGPVGVPPFPKAEAPRMAELAELTGAWDHHVFPGKLVKKDLNFAERAIFALVRAKEGDYRDWQQVTAWAQAIAVQLNASVGARP